MPDFVIFIVYFPMITIAEPKKSCLVVHWSYDTSSSHLAEGLRVLYLWFLKIGSDTNGKSNKQKWLNAQHYLIND
jgi:hypothetical protein